MTYERPTYESGAAQRDAWPDRAQTRAEILAAVWDPANQAALADSFEAHRQSIREHEESRKEDQ